MTGTFKIIAHGTEDWKVAVQLREEILRKPLGSKFTKEELDEEKSHIQVVGIIKNEIIATAVLVPEGKRLKMQRVVVSNQLRSKNIGSEMMAFCESHAKQKGFETMYCHARDSAVNFYLNNSYNGIGEYFDEDGIPHWKMQKSLG